jgi:hypothetical protein
MVLVLWTVVHRIPSYKGGDFVSFSYIWDPALPLLYMYIYIKKKKKKQNLILACQYSFPMQGDEDLVDSLSESYHLINGLFGIIIPIVYKIIFI